MPALLFSIIQKRNDNFSQALMDRLMQERKTLNDLSMLDPLTGLYNRRGLQNRSIICWRWMTVRILSCCWISTTSKPTTITTVI
jgi:hypothetical protein